MNAIILAGGFGTRLQSVVSDLPKPMATVACRPFLEWVLDHCLAHNVKKAILSVGYLHEKIIEHFGYNYKGIELDYAIETEPLGTGGAIRFALESSEGEALWTVLNGDTLFRSDLSALANFYKTKSADMVIALRRMFDFDRYGVVQVDEAGQVQSFLEKSYRKEGLINAGIYTFKADLLQSRFANGQKFSFEKDFMERFVSELNFYGLVQEGYFIDIGIPEDFEKANRELLS